MGYTPYGDHFGMQCGMEVVLANGEVVRTGMGAMPGNNTWQLFKYGFGPYVDGIFSQSNFGIVTKMGIWLMPEPPGYRPYMISFQKEDDIEQVAEILRPLKVGMVIQNGATVRSLVLDAAITKTKSQYWNGKGPIPDSVAKKIMADQDIGMWNFCGALYGPPPVMDALWGVIRDAFAAVPGAKFYTEADRKKRPDILIHRGETMRGIPKLTEFNFLNWDGGGGHIGFSPGGADHGQGRDQAIPHGELARARGRLRLHGSARGGLARHASRHGDRVRSDQTRRAAQGGRAVQDAGARSGGGGYGEYRTHIAYMDAIARARTTGTAARC